MATVSYTHLDVYKRQIQFWRDPLVSSATPAPGSSGPAPDTISAEFSILVSPIGGDAAQVIILADAAGNPVAGTVTQADGRIFTLTPDAPLTAGEYMATVFNAEQTTPMATPYRWTFTVIE